MFDTKIILSIAVVGNMFRTLKHGWMRVNANFIFMEENKENLIVEISQILKFGKKAS